jgi:hypothetical protein
MWAKDFGDKSGEILGNLSPRKNDLPQREDGCPGKNGQMQMLRNWAGYER